VKFFKRTISLLLLTALIMTPVINVNVKAANLVEHLENGDFEKLKSDGSPDGWDFKGGTFGNEFMISDDTSGTGKNSIKLKSDSSIYMRQLGLLVMAGNEYELSFYLKVKALNGERGACIKFEYLYIDENGATKYCEDSLNLQKHITNNRPNAWQKHTINFKVPEIAQSANFLLRLLDGGEIYYDNVSLKGESTELPPKPLENPKLPVSG